MNNGMALLRKLEERVSFAATHDPVTGLLSAPALIKLVEQALSSARPFSVLVILMDGLYYHAEHHGFAAGEHMMQTVGRRIAAAGGPDEMMARIEGEIFAVLTYDVGPEARAEQLCAAIREPIRWGGVELHLGAAAGIVSSWGDWTEGSELLPAGYTAARESLRRDRRGGVSWFTPEMRIRMARETCIEDRLRLAIASGGLKVAMQPKVRAQDGRIQGAEALVRWEDEVLGPVSPVEFVPIAERCGIIGDLTEWVLRSALAQAARWQARNVDMSVAVNVSAVDLRQPNFAEMVRECIEESGCEPGRLALELTESYMADDPDRAAAQFHALKSIGVSLSLDDFGTGYSSLSQLRRFPIDTLKIDRSFVLGTPEDDSAVAIVRTIVALARSLGMETVAEGVETAEQARVLRQLGVGLLQGYLFSRPVSAAAFATMIS